jgi:DNA-binding CsgD family transcriptional regulator
LTGTTASPLSREPARAWPLIGRSAELGRIASERAASSPGVVVLAQAGVGKSRLAREALAQAGRDGNATVWVQATRSAATVPLGAFAGVVDAEVGSDNLFELLRGSVRAMSSLAAGRPLVVGVDDAQLLDPTSAALVLHLISTATAFVLATVRSGEPCPDAIQSLWKDAGAQRLELLELSREETEKLVEAVVGGPVEESVRQWVWESSQGNALYASELVHGALSKQALQQVDGLWRMPVRPRISASLAELISAGMAEIAPDERGVLELLALGEPLRVSELVTLTPERGLLAAEARGLISVEAASDGGEVRLAHPLYGEAIRASLPSLRAHMIRVQLARLLQARERPRKEDSLRVARWLLDAGERIPEALLLDAADAANRSGDSRLAGELSRQALDAGAGVAAAFLLARSHEIRNEFRRAEEVLVAAEGQIDTQGQALEYLQLQIRVLYWGLLRNEELRDLFTRAQHWWPDEEWRVRLAPLRLYCESRDTPDGRSEVIRESSELLGGTDLDPQARRTVQFAKLNALFYSGRGREANRLALEIRPSLPARDAIDEAILRVACGASVETGAGLGELDTWATAALPAAVKLGDHATAGVAAMGLAFRCLLQGRFLEAGRWLAEAQVHQELHDPDGKLALSFALQGWVASAMGDALAAEAALSRGRAALRSEQPSPFEGAYLACAEAWATSAAGASRRAQQVLIDRAPEFEDLPLCETRLLYEAMRAGAPARQVAPRLRAISETCDSPLVSLRSDHAHHLAARDATALMQTVDQLEEIGADLYACEAAAHAATLFVGEGRHDSARRAAARSRDLFADDQGAVLPSIDGLDGAAVELTARERELAALARQGLTNQQIAERLVLSVRTVETFLYRAMRKLGVNDRRQL